MDSCEVLQTTYHIHLGEGNRYNRRRRLRAGGHAQGLGPLPGSISWGTGIQGCRLLAYARWLNPWLSSVTPSGSICFHCQSTEQSIPVGMTDASQGLQRAVARNTPGTEHHPSRPQQGPREPGP